MTRMIVLLTLAVLLVPDVQAHDAGGNDPAQVELQVNPAANDAVQVVERFLHHLTSGEVDAAAAYLDAQLLVLEAGGAERSRDEYLAAHAHADAEFLAGVEVQLRHRTADAAGELAWVMSESVMRGADDLVIDAAETMLLRRVNGDWRIIHIHWSSKRLVE